MTDESPEYGLVMPFVTVTSVGGPHDDDAYTAGYEMGRLDGLLQAARWRGNPLVATVIQSVNQPQADLIAMHRGFTAAFTETEVDGWIRGMFERSAEGSPE